MTEFARMVDLASERVGGRVLLANDEFFAPKENLLKPGKPVFMEDKYTEHGKWMDGWETRRRRTPGHDWCIVQLGIPGILRAIEADTSFFRGNYPEHCSLEACAAEDPSLLMSDFVRWTEVLPKSPLQGDSQNRFEIADPHRYTHLRLNIYPDGGVARLRVYGEAIPDWRRVLSAGEYIDLAAIEHGGSVLDCSDMFFSAPQNLLMPGRSTHMGDGWETKRRRRPGHDWAILRLGISADIKQVEIDTSHFKGNFPESCSLEICEKDDPADCAWKEILPRTPLQADSVHRFDISQDKPASRVRFNIYPDGGVARLRIRGVPTPEGRIAQGLRCLNSLPDDAARAALTDCCGSSRWVEHMLTGRPFATVARVAEAAHEAFKSLSDSDWLEAFQHHPKIGARQAAAAQSATAQRWSEMEQRSLQDTASQTLGELAEANHAYQARFGYIFIVCATGKSAGEMLDILKRRLANDPHDELKTAAEEQQKITRLRLEKMLQL